MPVSPTLLRIRCWVGFFIVGLVLSGVTAFPLTHELNLLARLLGVGDVAAPAGHTGLVWWILYVRQGLVETDASFPFLAYGTDWLAFGHLTIALFFIGPWIDPVRNRWCVVAGLIACAGVLPLALICGPIRGIPLYWRLIDCSFGIFGCIPLFIVLQLIDRLAVEEGYGTTKRGA